MLYYLLKYINEVFDPPGLGVIEYLTFRASAAAITALLITLVAGPGFIALLRARFIEPVKEEALPNTGKRSCRPWGGCSSSFRLKFLYCSGRSSLTPCLAYHACASVDGGYRLY